MMTAEQARLLNAEKAMFIRARERPDTRFEVITIRRVCPAEYGAPEVPEYVVEGEAALQREMRFVLASASGLASSVGDGALVLAITALAEKLGAFR